MCASTGLLSYIGCAENAPRPSGDSPEAALALDRWDLGDFSRSLVRVRIPVRQGLGQAPGTYETEYDVSTGVVIDENGHILTCAHALDNLKGESAYITLPGQDNSYRAKIIRKSDELELALLKVAVSDLKPVRFAASSAQLSGQRVALAGFPITNSYVNSAKPVFSSGLVSSTDRRVRGWETRPYLGQLIEMQAWVNRGFSGGPVFAPTGEMVGLVVFRLEENGMWGGYSLAIPVETIRRFLPSEFRYLWQESLRRR